MKIQNFIYNINPNLYYKIFSFLEKKGFGEILYSGMSHALIGFNYNKRPLKKVFSGYLKDSLRDLLKSLSEIKRFLKVYLKSKPFRQAISKRGYHKIASLNFEGKESTFKINYLIGHYEVIQDGRHIRTFRTPELTNQHITSWWT